MATVIISVLIIIFVCVTVALIYTLGNETEEEE